MFVFALHNSFLICTLPLHPQSAALKIAEQYFSFSQVHPDFKFKFYDAVMQLFMLALLL